MTPRHPARIGRYEVIDRLGAGGMGAVYLASDPLLGRTVAVKILHSDDEELRQRFDREARSAASLRHQHIVTIYDIGEDDGRPFLAMEFLDGESMAEIIRRRSPLPIDARLELIGQLCSGLGYAHRNGIIHRDIKPANLMITSERVLKIVDFGLARVTASGSTMTRAGVLMGTPHYMSPEQVSGTAVDHLSDIFSVGVVLYELILYRKAYAGDSTAAILNNIVHGHPAPIDPWVSALDSELAHVMAKGIERAKERRYPDLRELAADVELIRSRLKANAAGTTLVVDRLSPELSEQRTGPIDDGTTQPDRPRSSRQSGTPTDARRSLDAITQKRAAQIARHLAAASEHFDAGRLEPANEELEHALLLDPREERALQLLSRVHEALDDRQVSRWVDEARAEISHGSLTRAEELVEQALRLRSEATDARQLQGRIQDTRRERERASDRARAVKAALERARRNLQSGAFEAAARAATEALAYEQTHTEALALREEAQAALEQRRRDHEREQAAQDVAAQARAQADAGEHHAALARLREFDPPHAAVNEAIAEIEARMAALEQQRREEEQRARQKAAEEASRRERLATLRQATAAAFEREDWGAAREAVRAARQASPGDLELERLCRSIETDTDAGEAAARLRVSVQRHLRAGEAAIERGDLTAALKAADAAVSLMPKEPSALRLQQDVRDRLARAEAERQRLRREREEHERRERERLEGERLEQERLAREESERAEREQRERERQQQEQLERERRERERAEQERQLREQRKREEQERVEHELREKGRLEQERQARETREREERERLERERQDLQRLEQERIERERLEQENLELERQAREAHEHEERERLERERQELQRLEQERIEQERLEQERERQARETREREERERLERERQELQRLEQERIEQERLEKERLKRERQERLERERQERERLEQERAERERIEADQRERERLEQERLARERKERERREREEQARAEQAQKERERAEQAQLARERKEREKREREERKQLERERKERTARERQEEAAHRDEEGGSPAHAAVAFEVVKTADVPQGATPADTRRPALSKWLLIVGSAAAAIVVALAVTFWPSPAPPPAPGPGSPGPGDVLPDYAAVLQQALQQHSSGEVATAIRTALSIPESATTERPQAISLLQQIRRGAAAQTAIERRVAESAGKSREAAFTEAAAKQQEADKLSAPADTAQVVSLLTDASRLYRQAAMTGLSPTELLQTAREELKANRIPRAIDYAIQALSLAPRDVSILDFLRQIRAQFERQTQAAAETARRAGATVQNSAAFKAAATLENQARGATTPQDTQQVVETLARARDGYVQAVADLKQAELEKAQKTRDAANVVEQRLKANDADGATTALAALQRLNPNDPAVEAFRKRIAELRSREVTARRDEEIRKVLEDAQRMTSDAEAMKALQSALTQFANDSRIQAAIVARRQARDGKINDLLQRARAASGSEAIDLYDGALALDPSRSDISKERDSRRVVVDRAVQERGVREVIARFAAAFETRNVDDVLSIAPSVSRGELEAQFKPFREIRVAIEPFTVTPGTDGNSATVTCTAVLTRSPAGISARPMTASRAWRFTLVMQNGAWRIQTVQF